MDKNICLVKPTLELKKEALEYRRDHFQQGERIMKQLQVLILKTNI